MPSGARRDTGGSWCPGEIVVIIILHFLLTRRGLGGPNPALERRPVILVHLQLQLFRIEVGLSQNLHGKGKKTQKIKNASPRNVATPIHTLPPSPAPAISRAMTSAENCLNLRGGKKGKKQLLLRLVRRCSLLNQLSTAKLRYTNTGIWFGVGRSRVSSQNQYAHAQGLINENKQKSP
jgi:hypothetical protein